MATWAAAIKAVGDGVAQALGSNILSWCALDAEHEDLGFNVYLLSFDLIPS